MTAKEPVSRSVSAPHLAALYARAAERYGDLPAFATRRSAMEWIPTSFRTLYERGCDLATGLIDLGVEAREHIGLLSDNRLEWILVDYAVQFCGAADVPRGRDVTAGEIVYILRHAGVKVCFVETDALLRKVLQVADQLPDLDHIVLMEQGTTSLPGVTALSELEQRGRDLRKAGDVKLRERMDGISPDDLFTLIYTSGTTGEPKGVMLTHANMVSQIENIPLVMGCTDRVLSLLPVWHIYERVFEMISISTGTCTFYSSVRTLADDLQNVEPTFMGSAPRLWESLHQRILKKVHQSHPVRQALFHIARFLSHHYNESVFYLTNRREFLAREAWWKRGVLFCLHSIRAGVLLPWYGFFNAAVLERLRLVAGGCLKGTVSGGGALPGEVDRFFNYLGIPVLEGYGLTETSPVLAVRCPNHAIIGNVGPPIRNTEIRIVDPETGELRYPDPARDDLGRGRSGEIQVRGPQVMSGYYRNPEATSRAFSGDWFRTGDLGLITFNDCLKILGRCKETIVLLSGENLEPGPIEMRLRQSPLIEQCMVVGQDQKHIGVLLVPNAEEFEERGLSVERLLQEDFAGSEEDRVVWQQIRQRVSVRTGFKPHELIRVYRALPHGFRVGEELTNLQKLRRHVISDKYATLIKEMFESGGRPRNL